MRFMPLGLLATFIVAVPAPAADISELVSTAQDRESTAITVYNDDLALIKERRRIELPAGVSRLSLREVSAQMRPETALLRAVSGQPLELLEQNFDFDLLSPQTLLQKYVGREVAVIETLSDGKEKRETATVLAANGGVVLRFTDRIETGVPGRLAYPSVPPNLRDRPTLSVLLDAAGGKQSLELSYLTGGISWRADYVANLGVDGRTMDLSGWVTLTNNSGAAYEDVTLQLVAGTVNRVHAQEPMAAFAPAPSMLLERRKAEVTQEALMDFHLYSFERATSIADQQTKQLALLSANGVPVQRQYLLTGSDWYYWQVAPDLGSKLKPEVYVEFENRGGELGKPLPAGVIRVYARDARGAAQFVGEDHIEHTARNERVRLKLGEAFDITAERKQTDFSRISSQVCESSYRIELRNAKDEAVSVHVVEPVGGDWRITRSSHPSRKESATAVSWDLPVPAGGKSVLEYTVRTR
jgi:hypothetical protein